LNYDGWLTIEGFGFALKELSAAAAIWRDIERTPESIAFEGVKFLKKSVADGGFGSQAGDPPAHQ
jgi:D-psicose/D-tagatose/L-ribulose 3-epimerase